MKLLMAIIRDDHEAEVTHALNAQGYSVTRISSTGGFWRRGNTTLLAGVQDDRVDEALAIIDQQAGPPIDLENITSSHPPHRATIFILGVNEAFHF
jgi:uncharacterized protein YaaQ